MATIATLAVKLIADAKGFLATMDQAENKTKSWSQNVSKNLKDMGGKITDFGRGMTTYVTLPILGASVAAVNLASDLEETKNKVTVVFGSMSEDVMAWSQTSARALGQSQQQALSAAATYGNLFVSMGMGQKDAADMSMSLVQLASDLASFNNADPSDVLDALRSGLSGEVEPLKKFGVAMNDAILKAKAMELGMGDNLQALTEAQKLQLRYAIIMGQTATAQGDFARTADGLANSTRIAKAQFLDAAAALGMQLLPYALRLVQLITQVITWFQKMTPEQQKWILIILGTLAVLGPLLIVIGSLITAIGAIIGVVAAITTPMLVVVAVIALIIAGLALLYLAWQNNWFGIRDKTQLVIEFIKGIINSGMQFIQDLTSGKLGWMSQVWKNTMDLIATIIENGLAIWRHIKQAWRNLENGNWYMFGVELRKIWEALMRILAAFIQTKMDNIGLIFGNAIKKIIEYFKNTNWLEVGKNILLGILNGLWGGLPGLLSGVKQISQAVLDTFKGFYSIHSESKVMKYQVGWEMGAGTASGFEESVRKLLMPSIDATMQLPSASDGMSGMSAVNGVMSQPVMVMVDYHPMISTADENEAKFVLGPMIEDEIRRRERH